MTAILPVATELSPARTERIPVAILGATGAVGQRFIQLLANHPWFRVHEVVASDRSAGKPYGAAADWRLETFVPDDVSGLTVKNLGAELIPALTQGEFRGGAAHRRNVACWQVVDHWRVGIEHR